MAEPVTFRPEDEEIDLRRYFEVIWRRRSIVAWVTATAVIVALAVSLLIPRRWQAKTMVMVPEPPKFEQAQVVGGVQAAPPALVYSQETYARLLKSTVLLERVIDELHLGIAPEELARAVTAKPIRDTRLIEITVRSRNAEDAQSIASALAEALVEYDRQVISAELTQARKFVETQLATAKKELQAREVLLKEFSQRENLAASETEVNRRLAQLSSLRQTYEQNRLDLGVASRRLGQLKHELALTGRLRLSSTSTQANTLTTSVAAQLRAKLADLEAQRASLLERYTPSHPSLAAIDAQIQQTRQELAKAVSVEPRSEEQRANSVREQLEAQNATLEIELAGLQAKDRLLSLAITQEEREFRVQNARLAEKRAALNRLTRETEIARNTFATISAKATEAVIAEGMKSGFVRVVDRAVARPLPRGMVGKSLLAAILGLMAGTILVFVMDYFGAPVPVPAYPRTARTVPSPGARIES